MITNKYMKGSIIIVFLLSLFFLFFFLGCSREPLIKSNDLSVGSSEKSMLDEYENDFTLIDLEGNEISMHDYKGKIVVLNFWATWCPPCQAEIPDFVEVSDAYLDKGVQFVGISDDFINSLKAFKIQYKINYPILLEGTKDNTFAKWNIRSIPHTFILNGKGEIVFNQIGRMSKDQLIQAIETSLKENR